MIFFYPIKSVRIAMILISSDVFISTRTRTHHKLTLVFFFPGLLFFLRYFSFQNLIRLSYKKKKKCHCYCRCAAAGLLILLSVDLIFVTVLLHNGISLKLNPLKDHFRGNANICWPKILITGKAPKKQDKRINRAGSIQYVDINIRHALSGGPLQPPLEATHLS